MPRGKDLAPRRLDQFPIVRFLSKVRMKGTCWEWTGTLVRGYGQFTERSARMSAHRWSYMYYNGDIPAGLVVMHSCHVKACVNPEHLRLGTPQENVLDSDVAHTGTLLEFPCGHPRTTENIIYNRYRGCNQCKRCMYNLSNKWRREKRARLREGVA